MGVASVNARAVNVWPVNGPSVGGQVTPSIASLGEIICVAGEETVLPIYAEDRLIELYCEQTTFKAPVGPEMTYRIPRGNRSCS